MVATKARVECVAPPWWPPYPPHRKQALALWGYERVSDLVYGGAAGGGKSDYLLMAASQYCAHPGYAALIIRKTYQDLSLPGAIMDRAITWWKDKHGIRWNAQEHRFTWPSGAIVQFGHMAYSQDHLNYQGAELDFVGFDEATQLPSNQLTYLHSRLRDAPDSPIPIRYRLATNPGGVSHTFVRDEYVRGADGKTKVYLPALLDENPGVDKDAYRARLARLDPITRKQLESGDWDVQLSGGFFEVDKIGSCRRADLPEGSRLYRVWDFAATPEAPGTDPDYTVGLLLALTPQGELWILDIVRFRQGPAEVEERAGKTAGQDGRRVSIAWELEGGSSGKMAGRHLATSVFAGYEARGMRSTGSKAERARPVASMIHNGLVRFAEECTGWDDFAAELRAFSENPSEYAHDDQVDTLSLGHECLVGRTEYRFAPADSAWAARRNG